MNMIQKCKTPEGQPRSPNSGEFSDSQDFRAHRAPRACPQIPAVAAFAKNAGRAEIAHILANVATSEGCQGIWTPPASPHLALNLDVTRF
jgi:hypothetical protein